MSASLEKIGRLSTEEIKRMQAKAAKCKADNEAEAERISARNALESHAYTLRSTLRNSVVETLTMLGVTALVDMILAWLNENQSVAAFEYRLRQTELENISASVLIELSVWNW